MEATMVEIQGTCAIYTKFDGNDYYSQIYRLSGNIISILSNGLEYLRNIENDSRYDTFYFVVVPINYQLDEEIVSLNDIMVLDPVITIKPNKTVKDYETELSYLKDLSGITTVDKKISNLMTDYKNIIKNYNVSYNKEEINDNIDDILDCISKLITVFKNCNSNQYKILEYLDMKFYDGKISNSVVSLIYEKFGVTLKEFYDIVVKYGINFEDIKNILKKMSIDGSVQIKKKIFLKMIEKINESPTNIRKI